MHAIADIDPAAKRWEMLHERAAEVALVAGFAPEKNKAGLDRFAARFEVAGDWQQRMAGQGIDDIAAMLSAGMQALRVVQDRGTDASVPAQALWREFHAARDAVLAALDPFEAPRAA